MRAPYHRGPSREITLHGSVARVGSQTLSRVLRAHFGSRRTLYQRAFGIVESRCPHVAECARAVRPKLR